MEGRACFSSDTLCSVVCTSSCTCVYNETLSRDIIRSEYKLISFNVITFCKTFFKIYSQLT